MILETERLIVRLFDLERDPPTAFAMYSDEEMVRYIGGRVEESVASVRASIAERQFARTDDPQRLGYWAVEEKASGELVGNAILDRVPINDDVLSDDVQVGWHVRRDRWGRGYANEFGAGLLAHAERFGVECVCLILPENAASHAVARRLGLRYIGRTTKYYDGMELDLYRV